MKSLFSSIFIVLLLLVPKAYSFAQQSERTVNYKVTYNFSDKKYTVWVVPEYDVPNVNNAGQFELGATAQVTLAVPKDFIISNVTDSAGVWEKSPLKLGPGLPNQDWSRSSLDPDANYYIMSKSSDEANYGTFTSGTAVPLFTFESNECLGPVRIIQPDEPFINAAYDIYSLNVANSFYSQSGTPQGGNQVPLEQFKAVAGTVAICTVDFVANPDNTTTPPNTEVIISVLNNDTKNGFVIIPSEHEVFIDTPPENGTASVNSDGTINYTPNVGFTGIECFAYRVCEVEDPNVCRTANVCVTVPV
ncbi:MAG: Ig-like domain-containing protein, partial [Spirosomataceae bacterium]